MPPLVLRPPLLGGRPHLHIRDAGPEVGRNEDAMPRRSDDLRLRPAEDPLRTGVPASHHTLGIENDDGVIPCGPEEQVQEPIAHGACHNAPEWTVICRGSSATGDRAHSRTTSVRANESASRYYAHKEEHMTTATYTSEPASAGEWTREANGSRASDGER